MSDNRVLVGKLDSQLLTLTEQYELDDVHRAPVTSIFADGNEQFITISANEPVAHVWEHDGGQWVYDTYLTGTTGNLAGLGFMQQGAVAGIDKEGNTIAWNVERQKQRRQLERRQRPETRETPESQQRQEREQLKGQRPKNTWLP